MICRSVPQFAISDHFHTHFLFRVSFSKLHFLIFVLSSYPHPTISGSYPADHFFNALRALSMAAQSLSVLTPAFTTTAPFDRFEESIPTTASLSSNKQKPQCLMLM
jgi:hypothetical protein